MSKSGLKPNPNEQFFYEYLVCPWRITRRSTGNYSRDFIKDVRADDTFPRTATKWEEIDAYLFNLRADQGAFDAGKTLWRRYQKAQRPVPS